MGRTKTTLLIAAMSIGGLAWWLCADQPSRSATAPTTSSCRDARFALDYEAHHTAMMPGTGGAGQASFDARSEIKAVVSQRCLDGSAPGHRLVWSLEDVSSASVELSGQPLHGDASNTIAALEGAHAVIDVGGDGLVTGIAFSEDAPPVFVSFARAVVGETQLPRADHGERVHQDSQQGRSVLAVEREGDELRTTKLSYHELSFVSSLPGQPVVDQDVDHFLRATLDGGGHAEAIVASETLSARAGAIGIDATWSIEMYRLDEAPPAVEDAERFAAFGRRYRLSERPSADETQRTMMERKAAGLTWTDMEGYVRGVTGDERGDAFFATLMRMHALLETKPELVWSLAGLAEDATLSSASRSFVVDLLTDARAADAQPALLATLDASREAEGYTRHVQNLAFVHQPREETARFAVREMQEGTGDVSVAAAHAVGGVVGHLEEAGEPALARELNAELLAELRGATDPDVRARLLHAVANARLVDNLPVVVDALKDDHWRVRASAIRAAARTPNELATDAIARQLGDRSASVERAALVALGDFDDTLIGEALVDRVLEVRHPSSVRPALALLDRLPGAQARSQALTNLVQITNDPALQSEILSRLSAG